MIKVDHHENKLALFTWGKGEQKEKPHIQETPKYPQIQETVPNTTQEQDR